MKGRLHLLKSETIGLFSPIQALNVPSQLRSCLALRGLEPDNATRSGQRQGALEGVVVHRIKDYTKDEMYQGESGIEMRSVSRSENRYN